MVRGDRQLLEMYLQVDQTRGVWPEGARLLMEAADDFIAASCDMFERTDNAGVMEMEGGR